VAAAVRAAPARGTLPAVGFPAAAVIAVGLWLCLQGPGIAVGAPAAAVLVVLSALAARIDAVVAPRTHVSPAGAMFVAAGLVGGPVLGACAGASIEAFTFGTVWRKRSTWAGAGALGGFAAGVVGQQLPMHGAAAALGLAALGLLAGLAVNALSMALVALDRRVELGAEFGACWRALVLTWALPWLPLAGFLFVFPTAQSLALALAAALLLALALGNRFRLRLEQSLAEERSRARLDALTGAPNRYALAEALAAEQARIVRGDRAAALCFLDVDHFGDVNKEHGWPAGDKLLVDVYRRLRENLRASDLVFRWGGEEFVILAPRIDQELDLADFGERLRLMLARRPFEIEGQMLTVTASVGGVILGESRPPQAAIEAASRLARRAKEQRNTVIVDASHTGSAEAGTSPVSGT
jgi:diguanylate cyclase (GGDEF)-like protein